MPSCLEGSLSQQLFDTVYPQGLVLSSKLRLLGKVL